MALWWLWVALTARSSPGLSLSLYPSVSLARWSEPTGRYALGDGMAPSGPLRLWHVSAKAVVDPKGPSGAKLPSDGPVFMRASGCHRLGVNELRNPIVQRGV